MRIAVSAFFLDRSPTGLGIYTQNVLPELIRVARAHHQVTVFASHGEGLERTGSHGVAVRIIPTALKPKYNKLAALSRFVWSQAVFPSALSAHDLLYSPTHHGIVRGSIRQVITIHDLLPMRFPTQYRLQHYYFAQVLPRVIKRASAIIVVSESTRRDVHQFYNVPLDKMSVVYSAVDQKFKPASDKIVQDVKAKYGINRFVLMVGASFPHKNFEKAIRAFGSIRSHIPDMKLVIAGGRPEYVSVLKQLTMELNLSEVKFLGYVAADDLPPLYSSAQALLYPSLYEGFGLPPLEAMACGCPVIVSNTSSLPEVCGDAAQYVHPNDLGSIAQGLLAVLTDRDLQDRLRCAGLARVKLFSWDKAGREIVRVIESVAQERSGRDQMAVQ